MPASLASDGTLVKFCPSGVSDSVMAVLHADHFEHLDPPDDAVNLHAHHHSHHHAQHSVHHERTGIQTFDIDESSHHGMQHGSGWESNCTFGVAGTMDDSLTVVIFLQPVVVNERWRNQSRVAELVLAQQRRKQLSRAPPVK